MDELILREIGDQPFVWQDKSVLRFLQNNLKGTNLMKCLALYTIVCQVCSDKNNNPEIETTTYYLSEKCGMKRQSVSKILNLLTGFNLLAVERPKGENGRYLPTQIKLIRGPKTIDGKRNYTRDQKPSTEIGPDKNKAIIKEELKISIKLRTIKVNLLSLWNSLNIIQHKNWPDSADNRLKYLIQSIGEEGITEAMRVYSAVLKDPDCFFSYKWNLAAFIMRKNACEEWHGKSLEDFKTERTKVTPLKRYIASEDKFV